jgi:hypothetical protein
MKKNILLIISVLMIIANSCGDYLDIVPDNVATLDYAFKDRVRAEQFLATCYSYMPRHGLTESPGRFDDFATTYSNIGWAGYQLGWTILRDGNNVNSPLINYWDGLQGGKNLWQGIRDCNIFIERIDEVRDLESYEKPVWAAEAKCLKAYYHFFLMQLYGPIPIIRENLPISATKDEVMVTRQPVDDVVEYIVELIDEATPDLPLKIENKISEQGRFTQAVALALKAKVLVTAASPLFNGNQDYQSFKDAEGRNLINPVEDPTKWERAMIACKNAIDTCHAAGHALFEFSDGSLHLSEQSRLIAQVGQIVSDKWNNEKIWGYSGQGCDAYGRGVGSYNIGWYNDMYTMAALDPLHYGTRRGVYVPTLKAVEHFYTKNGVPIDEDITYDYDHRYDLTLTTEDDKLYVQPNVLTAQLHLDREPRFYGSIGFDKGWWYGVGRYNEEQQWPINAKAGEVSGPVGIERYSLTSFYIKKLSNFYGVYSQTSYIHKPWDWPLIRLADLYLLYAEALNETLSSPNQEVYQYVDMVRQRAGLNGVAESWSTYSKFPEKYTTKDGMREIIKHERGIELAFEEQRYWDLRRWGEAVQELNTTIQGWYYLGETDNDFYRVTSYVDMNYTRRDIFWPIRQYNLSVNTNLVQNPGW